MTWLGKILALVVMILALVWMYFTVNVYVTRTNWKNEADKYKKAYQEAIAARESEYRIHQSADSAYTAKIAADRTTLAGLTTRNDTLAKANTENVASAKALAETLAAAGINAKQLQANLTNTIQNESTLRERAATLENERIGLALKVEEAQRDRLLATNELRLATARQEEAERKLEVAVSNLREAQATGGRFGGGTGGPAAPAAAEGTRGTVTEVNGDLVKLSLGLDAGLQVGMTLDLMRIETGTYLGTVTILQSGLEPKQSVAAFKPKDANKPFARLRPDEKPKVGDQVSKLDVSKVTSR